ncbi:MAG: HDOD domain-containing protein [Burkholderiaceae bacterium]|nr:HDOD domain-containing protein [Burkholderiaceae bacterium]
MNQQSLLASALIGYEPIVDRHRNALAMRLRVAPRDQAASAATVYREVAACQGDSAGTMVLGTGAVLDEDMLAVEPLKTVWIEVRAALVDTTPGRALVAELHRRGFALVLVGRPGSPLPSELVPAFRMAVIDVHEDRRATQQPGAPLPPGVKRSIPYVQAGVHTIDAMEECFAQGAHAIIGWPLEDALERAQRGKANPDHATIIELIAMAERAEDPVAMEKLLRRDPSLGYRLLRYLNSPGFGLSVEVQSFRHAVMMLGHARLGRWLALLLATSSKDANMRPVMVASFRRGVFLEHLVGNGHDAAARDEVFILGVFSLLDKLFGQPFDKLFGRLNVPERVRETLMEGRGAYAPYLEVVRAIERGPDPVLRERLDDCVLSLQQCNEAILHALTAPDLVAG